jgi:hypothetical protein
MALKEKTKSNFRIVLGATIFGVIIGPLFVALHSGLILSEQ